MSLADCITKVTVSKDDQVTLEASVATLVDSGIELEQAERQAAQELLGSYNETVEEVRAELVAKGHDVEKQDIGGTELFQEAGLDEPVLLAQHNISAENLVAASELGGLAVPSLAISRPDVELFTSFGEIALLADRDLIDPQKDRAAKSFNADVYSPRFPQVSYKVDDKVMRRALLDLQDISKETGIYLDVDHETEDRGLIAFMRSRVVQYEYLKSIGKAPKIKHEKKPSIPKKLSEKYKALSIYEAADNAEFSADALDYYNKLADSLTKKTGVERSIYEQIYFVDGGVKRGHKESLAQEIQDIAKPPKVKTYELQSAIDKKLKTGPQNQAFMDWVENKYGGVIAGKQIPNGYTYTGARRNLPFDIETVVRILKKGLRDGENFNYGLGSVRSTVAKQFKSIKEIKAAKENILSSESFEKVKEETDEIFFDLMDRMRPFYKFDASAFGYLDAASEALKDFGLKGVRGLNESYNALPDDLLNDLSDFMDSLHNMPTEYFEVKIQRAVGIAEFSGAVVPSGKEFDKAVAVLRSEGVKNIKRFKRNDTAGREKAIQSFSKLFFQDSGKKRGSFSINAQGENLIKLFDTADPSTFLHESGHFFLEVMGELAASKEVTEAFSSDYQVILDWLGVSSKDEIKTEQHEQWARGFEAYLLEGKAPSVELEGAFDRFRGWLVKVYKSVKSLNVQLNDDVRGVMDRMLATDKEIEIARQRAVFNADPNILEMLTVKEQDDYIKKGDRAARDAREKLMKKAMKEITREKKEWFKNERKRVKEGVTEIVQSRPVYSVILDTKEEKMNRPAVEAEIGKEGRQKLPAGTTGPKGVHPEHYSTKYGFNGVIDMYEQLFNAERMQDVIERETDEEMNRRHGDILNDGTIQEEAMEAVHNESQADSIAIEYRTIARQIGAVVVSKKNAREAARKLLENKTATDASKPSKYLSASIRHAKDSGKWLAKKDFEKAADAKRKQLLNYYLYQEALVARDDIQKIEKKAKTFKRDGTRKSIHKNYRDQIDGLLRRFELLDSDKLQTPDVSFQEFVDNQAKEGEFVLQPEIVTGSLGKPYLQLTMGELRDVGNTIRSLQKNGREERSIEVEGQKLSAREAAEKSAESIAKVKKKNKFKQVSETAFQRGKRFIGELNAEFLRPEFLIKELDGGVVNGTLAQALLNPIAKAQKDSFILQEKVFGELMDILERGSDNKRMSKKIFDKESGREFTVKNIVSMALNMGNESNRSKLKRGGILNDKAESILFTDEDLVRLTDHLTKKEWDTVQDLWALMETMRPALQKTYSELTGVDMQVVEPTPVQTKFGVVQGGYWPIVYNNQEASPNIGTLDILGDNFDIPSVARGMGKSRTNFAAPVLLDFDVVVRTHIMKTTHLITHGVVVRDVNRVLINPALKTEILTRSNKAVYDNIKSWLVAVANNSVYDDRIGPAGQLARYFRSGISLQYLGFATSTAVKQELGVAALEASVARGEMSQSSVVKGFGAYLKNPSRVSEFVMEHSNEMVTRIKRVNADVAQFTTPTPAANFRESLGNAAFMPLAMVQIYGVDVPSWMSAYYHSMETSDGNHKKSVDFADAIIRQTQGGGNVKDLASIQRGNEFQRLAVTMFGTYMLGVLFPKLQELGRDAITDKKVMTAALTFIPLVFIPAILEGIMSGDEPDDPDKWLEWMTLKTLVYTMDGLPLGGQLVSAPIKGFSPSLGPAQSIFKSVQGFKSDDPAVWGKAAAISTGIILKVPAYQPYKMAEELYQIGTGKDEFSVREVFLGARDDEKRRRN